MITKEQVSAVQLLSGLMSIRTERGASVWDDIRFVANQHPYDPSLERVIKLVRQGWGVLDACRAVEKGEA